MKIKKGFIISALILSLCLIIYPAIACEGLIHENGKTSGATIIIWRSSYHFDNYRLGEIITTQINWKVLHGSATYRNFSLRNFTPESRRDPVTGALLGVRLIHDSQHGEGEIEVQFKFTGLHSEERYREFGDAHFMLTLNIDEHGKGKLDCLREYPVNVHVSSRGGTENQPPIANAGPDLTLAFPNTATLSGSVSDDGRPAGSTLVVNWLLVSGPGTVTFSNPHSAVTTATFSLPGTYVLRLTVNDSQFSNSDDAVVTVIPANQAPVVNAGANQTITLPSTASLSGTVTDDGLPAGGTLTITWSKVSGAGNVTFSNPNSAMTTVTFNQAGTYVLRLTANDSQLSSSSDVTIMVNPANQAPVVNAGANQTITLPSTASLSGTVSDDGLPVGSTLGITWSMVSGPGTVIFSNPNAAATTATFSQAGTYVLRLTANDSQLLTSADVTITVQSQFVQVPNVAGMLQADAESAIKAANLTVGTTSTKSTTQVPKGQVMNQNPAGGNSAQGGSSVDFLISRGNEGWEKTFFINDSMVDFNTANAVQQTSDGGYVIAGGNGETGSPGNKIWILKLDSSGAVQWQKNYKNSVSSYAYSIQQTEDGGYIVAGSDYAGGVICPSCAIAIDDGDIWLLKLDSSGEIQWQKTYGTNSSDEEAFSIQQTRDGGYIVAGKSLDALVAGKPALFAMKLNSSGAIEWQNGYGNRSSGDVTATIRQTDDGGYILAGTNNLIYGSTINRDIWLFKLTSSGEIEWQKTYGDAGSPDQWPNQTPPNDYAYSIQQTKDGGYIIGGSSVGYGGAFILKLDRSGEIDWQKTYYYLHALTFNNNVTNSDNRIQSIQQTQDGGYIASGYIASDWQYDLWVLKIDSSGAIEWQKGFAQGGEGGGWAQAKAIQQTEDGDYIVGGRYESKDNTSWYMWVLKLNSDGTLGCGIDYDTGAVIWNTLFVLKDSQPVTVAKSLVVNDTQIVGQNTFVAGVTECGTNYPPLCGLDTSSWPAAYVDQPYPVSGKVIDPNPGDKITFSLDVAPAGMTIDSTTGQIQWTPTQAQMGKQAVVLRCTDQGGLYSTTDPQADIYVEPGTHVPVITSTPVTTAMEGQPYTYQVVATDEDIPHGDVLTYQLGAGAPAGMTINPTTGLIQWTPTRSQVGSRFVDVRVQDLTWQEVGHTVSQDFTINVDWIDHAPTITSSPVTTATEGVYYRYFVTATDIDQPLDTLTFSLTHAPAGMIIDPIGGVILWFPASGEAGNQSVTVRVQDSKGLYGEQSFMITVTAGTVNHPPYFVSQPITTAVIGQLYSYAPIAADPDGDTVMFYLMVAPAGMVLTNDPVVGWIITWTPFFSISGGANNVTLRAQDPKGAYALQTFTITVQSGGSANHPPSITSTPIITATEGQLYSYTVTATDPDAGDVLTYSLTAAPTGMTINSTTGLIQWTPIRAQVPGQSVTVQVQDQGGLFAAQTFTITLAAVNHPPVITSSPLTTVNEGQLYNYAVTATDPDAGDILTYWLTAAPDGMAINGSTGLIQWTPTRAFVSNWSASVSVLVRDQGGQSTTQSFTITVVAGDDPPVITSSPITTVTEYQPYVYKVTVTDPDSGDLLTFSLDASPPDMKIDPSSGTIRWTPGSWRTDASQIGNYPVTIRVKDAAGLSDTQSFTLSVAPCQPGVVVTGPDAMDVPAGASNSIAYKVSLTTSFPATYTVNFSQSTDTSLSLNPAAPAGWTSNASQEWLVFQSVTGNAVGSYQVTASVTLVETGQTTQVTTTVNVVRGSATPALLPVGSVPGAIPIGQEQDVLFTSIQTAADLRPTEIVLEQVDGSGNPLQTLGSLVDDGTSGDLKSGDYVYSGTFRLSSGTEGKLFFRAKATYPGISTPVYTEAYTLNVTRFPVNFQTTDMSKVVTDSATGMQLISNRVLVTFVERNLSRHHFGHSSWGWRNDCRN